MDHTLNNELGKTYRPRQEKVGASCGALMLALERFKQNPDYKPEIVNSDYQQMWLEECLLSKREEIIKHAYPEKAITEACFWKIDELIHGYLHKVKRAFKVDKVALLGGIIINTDYGVDDYFDIRNFEVISTKNL